MKKFIVLMMAFSSLRGIHAQEIAPRQDIHFEDPVTKEHIHLETGSKVSVYILRQNVPLTGVIQHLTDSSMILLRREEHMFLSFRNIVSLKIVAGPKVPRTKAPREISENRVVVQTGDNVLIQLRGNHERVSGKIVQLLDSSMVLRRGGTQTVVAFRKIDRIQDKKNRYLVWVRLKSGVTIKGELYETRSDSIRIWKWQTGTGSRPPIWSDPINQPNRIAISEIASLKIRKNLSVIKGMLLGMGIGIPLGVITGLVTWKKPPCNRPAYDPCSSNDDIIFLFFNGVGGGVLGGVAGFTLGAMIGSTAKEFKVEGNPAQFDIFRNKFNVTSRELKVYR